MKLFIDTANVSEIKEAASWGIIDGVTTNPSLIAKEGRDFAQVVKEICAIVDGPVSAEVLSPDAPGMLKEAQPLIKIHPNVAVKIPMTLEGLKAVKELSAQGVKTHITLVFSANQALLAAKAGATFISPFVGRLDDVSEYGIGLIEEIVQIYGNYDLPTQVLAASIRTPLHVLDCAKIGAHIATVPFSVLKMLAQHPLTDIGIKKFNDDWAKAKK
ncbi:MAG: fructose-6-phosphate aldolase [Candidatus Edwardsbacteria bacterium RIFOXYD12_FULL_50_11]|uniref:Probable transaldolase n=1 Tax=Candidatus Edwardsbacteria bacterium GWF2_54_11 TaxID=1817851 RepID=A0A1F5R0S4_9BACT|nr:MAG: fructose-6-phosphate aldolase [Candidatus Edwardsbacteria bacterium RifOxyC12_full_54_24]OGF08074.1 MAG: fructose-6-phosphate aldolase [Candidatus Edwardsbacteria bacterium GWF2_54_11]OGF08649.1 MAG: fructose-6-phosphate aldolase [Candidatus Edwardsbacteria bacterium RifOxyA12_full_54_48]OGF11293.1 MAG: fructose-6-phosphate aldolase [Candidatus Edwardsbacteria bacterium GWE2_54_12]OGF16765.1 MAG: fructose-6-phosphate aldolase [Candidatus Edwardsbacteria bacterium RIFOXYD12_FULL_50_11]O